MNGLDGYKMLGTFGCGDKLMVIIEAAHGTHVMTSDEWETIRSSLDWDRTPSGMRCLQSENNVA